MDVVVELEDGRMEGLVFLHFLEEEHSQSFARDGSTFLPFSLVSCNAACHEHLAIFVPSDYLFFLCFSWNTVDGSQIFMVFLSSLRGFWAYLEIIFDSCETSFSLQSFHKNVVISCTLLPSRHKRWRCTVEVINGSVKCLPPS